MKKEVVMPKLGLTMESGTVTAIYVKVGDAVNEGDTMFDIETNKLTESITAPAAGTVVEIRCNEYDDIPVAEVVAVIEV